jgi:hypothetical protein
VIAIGPAAYFAGAVQKTEDKDEDDEGKEEWGEITLMTKGLCVRSNVMGPLIPKDERSQVESVSNRIRPGFDLDSTWIRFGLVRPGFDLDSTWIRPGFDLDSN